LVDVTEVDDESWVELLDELSDVPLLVPPADPCWFAATAIPPTATALRTVSPTVPATSCRRPRARHDNASAFVGVPMGCLRLFNLTSTSLGVITGRML
jgi:hypothetical protein